MGGVCVGITFEIVSAKTVFFVILLADFLFIESAIAPTHKKIYIVSAENTSQFTISSIFISVQ